MLMHSVGTLSRSGVVDPETFFQQYEAMKEDYDALRKRYADLIASHSGTVHKLELSQVRKTELEYILNGF